jgi:hypothetical protein
MSRHHPLTQRDHKKIGGLLSQGMPFHRALNQVQNRTRFGNYYSPTNGKGFRPNGSSSDLSPVQTLIAALELISGFLTLLGVVKIYQTFGFGLGGTIVVLLYLGFWEFVGRMFDQVRKKTPTPLRFLVTIIEELFGFSVG